MNKGIDTNVQKSQKVDIRNWLILLALGLVWGSSFILIKKALIVFSPNQVATMRLSISALAFLPFLLVNFRKVDWSKWKYLVIVGACGSTIPAFMFSTAQTQISSSITGILNSLTPLFTLTLGILIFGRKGNLMQFGAVVLGLIGAAMLILMGSPANALSGNLWYSLLIIIATICYATSGNTVGSYLNDMPSLIISSVSFSIFGYPALVYLFTTDFTHRMQTDPFAWTALGYVAILAIFGTVVASVFFFMLVQWTNPLFSSMVTYLIPIIALAWGVIDGEMITIWHFIGMGLILSGIYLSKRRKKKT